MSWGCKRPGCNCRNPQDRSKKLCCCGGHSTYARKKKKRFSRETLRKAVILNESYD